MRSLLTIVILFFSSLTYGQYTIDTYAGDGVTGYLDSTTSKSQFNRPVGITSDDKGNVFICDFRNHCIRKISSTGDVTTIAGTPRSSGYVDGSGSIAKFNQPGGICLDDAGNIYVTDNFNHRIRKIDTNNNVTTIAGDGSQGYIDSTGTNARLNIPRDIDYDPLDKSLYFVDRNHVIRRIDSNNKVSTFAGTGISGLTDGAKNTAQFFNPASVEITLDGSLIIADKDNHVIRMINANDTVSTIAGDGVAGFIDASGANARFNRPINTSVDKVGNIYVTDFSNYRIRKIDTNNNVTTIAGDGTKGFQNGDALTAKLGEVFDIEIIEDQILFTDAFSERIRRLCSPTFDTIKVSSCNTYLSPSGRVMNASNDFSDTILNMVGCDSIIWIQLTINNSSFDTLTIDQCDMYISPSGMVFTASSNFSDTVSNSVGCDSIIWIQLTINNSFDTLIVNECNEYVSPSGMIFTNSSNFSDTIFNTVGCDSIMWIELTIDNDSYDTLIVSECNEYVSPSGMVYTASSNFSDTIPNAVGCDSIIQIELTIDTVNTEIRKDSSMLISIADTNLNTFQWIDCSNDSIILGETMNNFSANTNGDYAVIVTNNLGCVDTSECFNIMLVGLLKYSLADNGIIVFPNPSSNLLNVRLNRIFNQTNIVIRKITGEPVLKQTFNLKRSYTINHNLSSGVYMLEVRIDNKNIVYKKFMVR